MFIDLARRLFAIVALSDEGIRSGSTRRLS